MYDVKLPDIDWLRKKGSIDRYLEADPAKEQNLIMFYGASNFTRWSASHKHRPLEEDIRRKDGSRAAVNHGFGTSTAEELLYYYDRLVRPWNPRALVLSSGLGNARAAGYSVEENFALMCRVLDWARHDFPGIKLYLCNGYPTRKERVPARIISAIESDELARDYCLRHDDTTLADATKFPGFWIEGHMGDYNYARPELFVADNTHFNQTGYDVYRDFFLSVLDDIL